MKPVVNLALALVCIAANLSAYGQGTILFNNRVTGQVDAPLSRTDGTGAGAGVMAQLFLVSSAGAAQTYIPLFPMTTFRTTSAAASYYVQQPASPVVVPGIPAGSQATVVMRAWEGGGTYDDSMIRAQSVPVTITLGGIPPGGGAPIPDAVLVGLQFVILPEPSTGFLGLLGAAALLFYRRENKRRMKQE